MPTEEEMSPSPLASPLLGAHDQHMLGAIVAVVGAGGLVAGMIALGRWLGSDKQTMRDARDAHNAQRYRKGDHDGQVGGGMM